MNTRTPHTIHQMLLFRISRFFGTAGGLALRMCEARFGITRREWGVLAALASKEGQLSSELAAYAQLDRVRTSRALSGLEAKGWVVRQPLPSDRRHVRLFLTEQGRAMYERVLPEMACIHQDLVSVLSDEELAQFNTTLAKLQAQASAMEQQDRYVELPKAMRVKRSS